MSQPLTDIDIEFTFNKDVDQPAKAIVWVIDGQCLYDIPTKLEYAEIFSSADEVIDISADYPDHDGLVVRLLKDGEVKMELMTTEYFGNILLSNPQVVDLTAYPYGRYVVSPNATFDGASFTITNRDVTGLPAWMPGHEPSN